jgi:hypothetical protein
MLMQRILAVPARLACLLALVLPGLPTAFADDAARIGRLETEIQQLRTLINEQARRIQRLEDELSRRAGQADPQPRPRPRVGGMRTDVPASAARQPWHGTAAWDRVATGMSAEEVTQILGEPTSAESIGELKSLFYRGAAPGGPPLSGHVNFKDGRVVAVSKPEF